jgi:peptide/nickel transport system ATP-binding protein
MENNGNILTIENLKTFFFTPRGTVKAANGVNFAVRRGECLCLVGESGCGKSVTALSILRLFESPPGRIVEGSVKFGGRDLVKLDMPGLRSIRGKDISLIFQDAQSALNPVFNVGDQIEEQLRLHLHLNRHKAAQRSVELLAKMGIPDPERAASSYPHQLSGGMRQRAMIAMGLSCDPHLLIADEPTTAVDVTIKAQILDLFREMQSQQQMSILFITHDFGVVSEIGDRAVIIYGGEDVETAPVEEIINSPAHPYTVSLLACLPDLSTGGTRLHSIPGAPPNPADLPSGCTFHPRCNRVMEICRHKKPARIKINDTHEVSCHLYGDGK